MSEREKERLYQIQHVELDADYLRELYRQADK